MRLAIQVVDEGTASIELQATITVPDDIPYPDDNRGPISLWGLKTALDYYLSGRGQAVKR